MPESEDAVLLQRRARRRLVGAIALVVFVVIALPILFDKEPRPITHDLAIEIPSQDSGKFKPRMLPPEAPAPQAPGASAEEQTAAPEAPAAEKPRAVPDARKLPESRSDKSAPVAHEVETFMVPLGAYSNPANAKQVQSRVAAAGYKTYSEQIKNAKGAQLRVRAGPFPTRDAAERAREKLKSLGLNPVGAVAVRERP